MWRQGFLVLLLASCSPSQPQPLSHTLLVPQPSRGCHPPAPDPKSLPPIRTVEQLKQWAAATAHARDIDKLSLMECERKLDEAVDALEGVRQRVDAHSAGDR